MGVPEPPVTSLWTSISGVVKTHVFYVVLIAVGLIAGHSWLVEHDLRLQTAQELKVSQTKIDGLTAQIASIQAQAAKQIAAVKATVVLVKTPAQAVAAIPQLTDTPLNARVIPSDPTQIAVDAVPLTQVLGQCRQDAIALSACTETGKAKDAIIETQKGDIKQLKKPQSFWSRTLTVIKSVGIGIGIGALLGAHGL